MLNIKLKLNFILIIVFIIIFVIMSFVVSYIIGSVDPKYSITCYFIAISFVVIFATFSGAYLDTKISGDKDRKS